MVNQDLTQLLVIVDRSGSMASIQEDMRGALNEFFKAQAAEDGKCVVDYAQFDGEFELVYTDKDVSEAEAVLQPRGSTALLDAIGKASTQLGEKLRKRPEAERPGTVIVAVVTDGGENSSREWTRDSVAKLIKDQTDKWNWDFVFLGANMDAVAVGTSFGFNPNKSMTYNVSNTGQTMSSLSTYASATRSAKGDREAVLANAFSDEDRKNATKE